MDASVDEGQNLRKPEVSRRACALIFPHITTKYPLGLRILSEDKCSKFGKNAIKTDGAMKDIGLLRIIPRSLSVVDTRTMISFSVRCQALHLTDKFEL